MTDTAVQPCARYLWPRCTEFRGPRRTGLAGSQVAGSASLPPLRPTGWASFYPCLTVVQHGIPCYEVQLGDVFLPPGHRDAINCDDSVVFDTFRRSGPALRPSV